VHLFKKSSPTKIEFYLNNEASYWHMHSTNAWIVRWVKCRWSVKIHHNITKFSGTFAHQAICQQLHALPTIYHIFTLHYPHNSRNISIRRHRTTITLRW
jgi:hypothetical protein